MTGQTAVGVDISQSLASVFPLYLVDRGRSRDSAADPGVPIDPGADQGRGRLRDLARNLAGRHGRRLPVGLAQQPAGPGRERAGDLHPAAAAHRHPVRPGDGLRGLPRHPHARGLRPRHAGPTGRRHRLPAQCPCRHRRSHHHDGRLRRLRARRRRDHQDHRFRAHHRRPRRRVPGPHDARARLHVHHRRADLVAARAGSTGSFPTSTSRARRSMARLDGTHAPLPAADQMV